MKSAGVKFLNIIFLLIASGIFAQTPDQVVAPKYTPEKKLVHDFGNMLNAVERNQLENKLVAYDDSTSVQIAIVTFKKLDGYPIDLLASEIGEKWGVGQKDQHNGIVIVLSNDDRKVSLRGGYGIQAKMPPTIEKLIIDREMVPQFKNGDYYQGLDNAINAIQKQLAGQYNAKPKDDDSDGLIVFLVFLFVIIIFIVIASKGGGSGGNRSRRGFNWGDIIFTGGGASSWGSGSSWGGGGSGGGFGGGGFGGFGGGSFGGGGASGSW